MNSTSPSDIPEYRGKTLTPVSPRPVHLPAPSNIPVLKNQMDPVFNETSTHIDPSSNSTEIDMDFTSDQNGLLPGTGLYPFSYPAANNNNSDDTQANGEQSDGDGNDDYAMSLDLEDDDIWESNVEPSNTIESNYSTTVQPPVTSDTILSTEIPPPASTVPYGALPPSTNTTIEQTTEPTISSQFVDDPRRSIANENKAIDAAGLNADAAAPAAAYSQHNDSQNPSDQGDDADMLGEGVDIQALLDDLSPPNATTSSFQEATPSTTVVSHDVLKPGNEASPSSGSLTAHPNLPPRPPPQEKPTTHAGYPSQDDIRSYHPHNQTPLGASGFPPQPANTYRPNQGLPPTVVPAGAPGTATHRGSTLPPPPLATFQQPAPLGAAQQQQSPTVTSLRQREKSNGNHSKGGGGVSTSDDDEPIPWGPEIQKAYDDFLQEERVYVNDGQWDRFPPNSRLFIGNLPSEKVNKRDLFYIFERHGRLAQISIKQAYGFIQFLDADACQRALQAEQGSSVRGRKMHLEISKPQKNTRNSGGDQRSGAQRRSRSPDYSRGASSPRNPGFAGGRGDSRIDRGVDNRTGKSARERPYRARDDYRPARSPSPRGRRASDEYRRGRDRSRDRFDRRSRSRSPPRRGNRYPSRSPPSRWSAEEEADKLLPKRQARDVPEVQFLLLDELDRNFINYVDKAFRDRGIRTDVLFLNPRLSLAVVIRRQIIEGVHAIVKLSRPNQVSSRIPIQVFDRTGSTDTVRFDEYDNLEPYIAAELAIRARPLNVAQTPVNNTLVSPQGYQAPQYGQMFAQPSAMVPASQQAQQLALGGGGGVAGLNPAGTQPNLTNLITSLDGPALQKLLGALQQQQSGGAGPTATPLHHLTSQQQQQHQPVQPVAPPQPALPVDLASLFRASVAPSQPIAYAQPQPQPQPQVQTNPYATALAANPILAANPALASFFSGTTATAAVAGGMNRPTAGMQHQHQAGSPTTGQQQQQQQQPTSHVQNIMEQLAKWKQA
ncbi:MAG: hypothetical protein M1816_007227 [Peltula sp. TS41687]|nr:MAG: hypothetical protein M1816_007227 [Peltula sp. TS41687]